MQTTHLCHKPCPDLPCYSLNKEQKQHGLEMLEKVRKQLGEKQLEALREEYPTASRAKKARLNEKAQRIEQVWC